MENARPSSRQPEEPELSKKSYEVAVPLLTLEKPKYHEIYNRKESASAISDTLENKDLSESDDETGRPILNPWNRKNHPLHVLGQFKSDFEKNLAGFMEPSVMNLEMDPFCRSDVDYKDDVPIEDAFLLWQRPGFTDMVEKAAAKNAVKIDAEMAMNENEESEEFKEIFRNTEIYDSSDENDGSFGNHNPDSDSEAEEEILSYIKTQKEKRRQLENATGETLYFDGDEGVIRNLHENGSISMTNYGRLHGDEKIFGNTKMLFDELSEEEKRMLTPAPVASELSRKCSEKKLEEKDSRVFAAGDYC